MALALALAAGVRPVSAAPGAMGEVFLDVIVTNRVFAADAPPMLSVRTREPVNLDCLVYDSGGNLVAHRATDKRATAFGLEVGSLAPVPKGVWLFCLVASDAEHKLIGFYPKAPGGGEIIQVRESSLDPDKKTIRYFLPRAACVRVRAGFREGLYLHPVISGEVQTAGEHLVAWDGSGQDGLFTNLYQHPSLQVSVLALSLPVNILATEERSYWRADNAAMPTPLALPAYLSDLAKPPWTTQGTKGNEPTYLMADDYTLSLEAQQDAASRTVEVKTDCSSANRARLFNKRFELMLFLDTTFLVEDERSQLPFSYRLSTRGLAPGRHIFTANVVDADSAVGTVSREFNISFP
jgi:hypothetical protein